MRYPRVGGIAVLLGERTSLVSPAHATNAPEASDGPVGSRLRNLIPANGRSRGSRRNYEQLGSLVSHNGHGQARVLVLGGRTLGTGLEELLSAPVELVETDIAVGPRTMVVCDAQQLPFADETFDAVVAQAVLSVVPDPPTAVAEIHRLLADGGLVYAENSFMQQVWGGAFDFHRWTDRGHRRLFSGFEEIAGGMVDGPATTLAWSWEFFLLSFARSRLTRRVLGAIGRFTAFWLTYLDAILASRPASIDGASALFFLGRKTASHVTDQEIVAGYRGWRES
jgi:SAM-dependent methyltransferase